MYIVKGWKRTSLGLLLALLLAASMMGWTATSQGAGERGPPLDEIQVTLYDGDFGDAVADVADGTYDGLLDYAEWSEYEALPPEVLEDLTLIRSAHTYIGLLFNPVQNVYAPSGTLLPGLANDTSGNLHFNPFALRKARYAVNFLLDRDYIADTLMSVGEPSYMAIQPSSPAYPYVSSLVAELGLTRFGNATKAQQMFNEAMEEAAGILAGYGYTLELRTDDSGHEWWYFEGQPVTVKFYIRNDDERRNVGPQIAEWIEEYFHIEVQREFNDRETCLNTVYLTDPADYAWNMYTEGWFSRGENPPSEDKWAAAQFYAPWLGWMPGLNHEEWWRYENSTLDDVSTRLIKERVGSTDEFWQLLRETVKMGMQESVRIFVAEESYYYPFNQYSFVGMVPGTVTGVSNPWWARTLNISGGAASLGAQGTDGVLLLGWNGVWFDPTRYDNLVASAVADHAYLPHPRAGTYVFLRANYTIDAESYHLEGDEIVGDLDVPGTAMIYNSTTKSWENVPAGTKAAVKVVYNYMFSNWHDGHPMTMADILYLYAFMWEWTSWDSPDDPLYDEAVRIRNQELMTNIKGIEVINDTAIAVYGDYVDPLFSENTAAYYALWPQFPWQLYEAMAYCIVNGGPDTGTSYSWREGEDTERIELIHHWTDIEAAYEQLDAAGYIPPPLVGMVSASEAHEGYSAGMDFMEAHGHAVISNGPFVLDEVSDASARLTAFRDPTYPYGPADFYEMLGVSPGAPVAEDEAHAVVTGTGEVSVEDMTVEVEAEETMLVSVTKYASEPVGKGGFNASLGFFEIEVSDEGDVAWPINVEYHYTDEEVEALGIPEGSLAVYFYNSTSGRYERCGSTGVDTVNNVVWANITMEEYMASGVVIGLGVPAPPTIGGVLAAGKDMGPRIPLMLATALLALIAVYAARRVWAG